MISLNSNDDSNIYRAMSYKLIRLFTRPIQIITHKKNIINTFNLKKVFQNIFIPNIYL